LPVQPSLTHSRSPCKNSHLSKDRQAFEDLLSEMITT